MRILIACVAMLLANGAWAQEAEVAAQACPDPAVGPVVPPAPDRDALPVTIYAKQLDGGVSEINEARGDVELIRGDQRLTSQRLIYDPQSQVVRLPEPLEYSDDQVWINAQQAEYSFADESGEFSLIDYGLSNSSANGSAESFRLHAGERSVLRELNFTTCAGERPEWQLKAEQLELDHENGIGYAKGARLEFQGVPVLYAPWFSFPIDDRRKSGFLYPSLNNTNDNGFEIGTPYYWNIAPNMDATIEPRYLTERGFMLTGEYRLLTRRSNGQLNFDYMPDDDQTDDERYHYRVDYGALFSRSWDLDAFIDRVSDDFYFQDFGSNLEVTSRQFLRSAGIVHGYGHYWTFEMLVDDFQVIDDSVTADNEPYRRLPRLAFMFDRPLGKGGLGFLLDSELSYFDRDFGVDGARLDVGSHLYWEQWTSWGFIRPSAGYRYTTYDLDDTLPNQDASAHRGLSVLNLDGGLFFDKPLANGNTQTLEPRLFYLYVPFEDQDDLPDFDSGNFTFGFSQLYNDNRFTGADRQGDANRLSLALTTRSLSGKDGNELWRFSLGQIFYFSDLRVQLDDNPVMDDNLSPFIAEFSLNTFRNFTSVAGLQWDWEEDQLDVASFGVSYSGDEGERASFQYRFRRDRVDQFDVRLLWPVGPQWRLLTRFNYSFRDDESLETQAGFEYESCCWAIRTVYRRYLKNRFGNHRDGIYLELNLKGLASVGTGGQDLFKF